MGSVDDGRPVLGLAVVGGRLNGTVGSKVVGFDVVGLTVEG